MNIHTGKFYKMIQIFSRNNHKLIHTNSELNNIPV